MEESTQRRERLKLMRLEASQEAAATFTDDHSTTSLSNPLLESTSNPASQVQSSSRGFNYYTNPMAAYSGSRQPSPQMSHDYSSTPQRSPTNVTFPSPSVQPQINHSPNPRMQRPPGHYANPNHTNIPVPSWNSNSPHLGGYHGHGPGRGFPSPGPNFMHTPNHGPSQGRGHWFRNNMSSGPSLGRGMGRGRGRGATHNHVSAENRPDRFFNKSMVEDPWKFLEPVIWKSNNKQWLPHSLIAKKPRVSESPKQSSSQPSLAEILAASFNEASNDEPNAG